MGGKNENENSDGIENETTFFRYLFTSVVQSQSCFFLFYSFSFFFKLIYDQ